MPPAVKKHPESDLISLMTNVYAEKNPWINSDPDRGLETLFAMNKLVKENQVQGYKGSGSVQHHSFKDGKATFDSELIEMIVAFESRKPGSDEQFRNEHGLLDSNDTENVVATSYNIPQISSSSDDDIADMSWLDRRRNYQGTIPEFSSHVQAFSSRPRNSISKSEKREQWNTYRKLLKSSRRDSLPRDYISDPESFTQILEAAEHAVGSSHIIKTLFEKVLSSEDSILINKLIREAAKIQWERAVKQESSSPKSTKEKSLEFRETTRLRRKQVTRDLTPQEYTLITDFYKRIVSKADPDVLLDLLVTEAIRLIERRMQSKL